MLPYCTVHVGCCGCGLSGRGFGGLFGSCLQRRGEGAGDDLLTALGRERRALSVTDKAVVPLLAVLVPAPAAAEQQGRRLADQGPTRHIRLFRHFTSEHFR